MFTAVYIQSYEVLITYCLSDTCDMMISLLEGDCMFCVISIETTQWFITDHISKSGNAVTSICLSIHPSAYIHSSFEPTNRCPGPFASM